MESAIVPFGQEEMQLLLNNFKGSLQLKQKLAEVLQVPQEVEQLAQFPFKINYLVLQFKTDLHWLLI